MISREGQDCGWVERGRGEGTIDRSLAGVMTGRMMVMMMVRKGKTKNNDDKNYGDKTDQDDNSDNDDNDEQAYLSMAL